MDIDIALRRMDELTNISTMNISQYDYVVINMESLMNPLWYDDVILALSEEGNNREFRARFADIIMKNIVNGLAGKRIYFVFSSDDTPYNQKFHETWNSTKLRGKGIRYGSSNIYSNMIKLISKWSNISDNMRFIDSKYEPNWITYGITKLETGKGVYLTRDYLDYSVASFIKIYDGAMFYRIDAGNNKISPIKHERLIPMYLALNGCSRHHNFSGVRGYGYVKSAKYVEELITAHGEEEDFMDKLFNFDIEILEQFKRMIHVFDVTKIKEMEPEVYEDVLDIVTKEMSEKEQK